MPLLGAVDRLVRASESYLVKGGKLAEYDVISALAEVDDVSRLFAVLKEYLEARYLARLKGEFKVGLKDGYVVILLLLCKKEGQSVLPAGTGVKFENLRVCAISEYFAHCVARAGGEELRCHSRGDIAVRRALKGNGIFLILGVFRVGNVSGHEGVAGGLSLEVVKGKLACAVDCLNNERGRGEELCFFTV